MTDLETIKSLQEELDRIVENQNETKKQCEEMKRINEEREQLFKELAERNMALSVELDIKTADLAQMKSTLSYTQQKLRAVQEDRDEFAAKMNDAVERAEQLQARCGDLESICAAKKRENSDLLAEKVSLLQEKFQLIAERDELKEKLDKAEETIQDATTEIESITKIVAGFGEAFRFVVEHWRGGGT